MVGSPVPQAPDPHTPKAACRSGRSRSRPVSARKTGPESLVLRGEGSSGCLRRRTDQPPTSPSFVLSLQPLSMGSLDFVTTRWPQGLRVSSMTAQASAQDGNRQSSWRLRLAPCPFYGPRLVRADAGRSAQVQGTREQCPPLHGAGVPVNLWPPAISQRSDLLRDDLCIYQTKRQEVLRFMEGKWEKREHS